jgi:hypothetical protein
MRRTTLHIEKHMAGAMIGEEEVLERSNLEGDFMGALQIVSDFWE